jgi:hypothetical protein
MYQGGARPKIPPWRGQGAGNFSLSSAVTKAFYSIRWHNRVKTFPPATGKDKEIETWLNWLQ